VGASGHRHRDARAGRGRARRGGGPGGGRSRGAGLAAPSMLWRCGWPAARARRQLRTVEPVKAPLQRRSRLAPGQEGGMRTPRAGPMGCCCRYTPALSTRATNVASSGGSSGSECQDAGGVGWGGQSRRAAALRRSGWRHAHDHRRRSLCWSAPTIGLATRHSRPARAPRAPQLPPSLLCSNVDRQARNLSSDSLCGRRHGGGTHRRPLWYIWRGSPRARGSPGLTAAVVGRAQPCRPPAEPGLNPPSPPAPTGRWDSPGAPGRKILCRWGSPGRSD